MVEAMIKGKEQQQNESPKDTKKASTKEIVLEAELDQVKKELADVQARENYWKKSYTISRLTAEVTRMETGLPTREVFDIVVNHALRFKDSITYFSGWKVESITFEDQNFYNSNEDKAKLHQPSPCTVIQLQCWNNSKYCNYFYSCFAFYFISRYMYHDICPP